MMFMAKISACNIELNENNESMEKRQQILFQQITTFRVNEFIALKSISVNFMNYLYSFFVYKSLDLKNFNI